MLIITYGLDKCNIKRGCVVIANPQKEDGHVDIANEIVEALAKIYLSSRESQILWAIFRKTYGWHKKIDWITGSQLVKMTGISKSHISETLKRLVQRNLVIKNGNKLGFQKDYELWEKFPNGGTIKKFPNGGTKSSLMGELKFPNGGTESSLMGETQKKLLQKKLLQKKERKNSSVFLIRVKEIITYLNEKAGKGFGPETTDTQKFIKARLKEGHSLEAFKWVIDVKCAEWKNKFSKDGTPMENYLRPETLFGNKFEGYLNQFKYNKKEAE
ncbi:hypothetical protein ES705_29226 [subsurface metagenome]